jgi:hypothetical protein
MAIAKKQIHVAPKPTADDNAETGSATVTVASKLPFDLVMCLYDFTQQFEPVMGGGAREYKIAQQRRGSKMFIINGCSYAQNKGPHQQLSDGFAITHDIPKDFWDEWKEQCKEADFIVNGLIFANEQARSTYAEAKEKAGEKSGLERLDPNNLPKGLQQADRKAA